MIRLTDGHNVTLVYEDKDTILEHIYLITGKWQSQQPVCEPHPLHILQTFTFTLVSCSN